MSIQIQIKTVFVYMLLIDLLCITFQNRFNNGN